MRGEGARPELAAQGEGVDGGLRTGRSPPVVINIAQRDLRRMWLCKQVKAKP